MTASEYQRLNLLFAAALETTGESRDRFLDRECGRGTDLRREVERLLAEHERTGGLLDRPLFGGGRDDALSAGSLLNGRYRIERLLAHGGMAHVYLASDLQLAGRRVVVKFLHRWARQYAWLKSRFLQEMEALARIEHQAVVGILDTGETPDGVPFLVIEYVDGVTLRSEIERGLMDLPRAARILRQIGRAVEAAHAKGVLHRDLKPENIMLESPGTEDEYVRLIDFGIARLDEPGPDMPAQTTQLAGTTAYMSPEQLRGKPAASTDIYAIGVIAYEMVSGRRPFSPVTPVELYEQQRAGAKGDALRERPEMPESAVRLILRQLSFRPEQRSASAVEAGDAIASALTGPAGHRWPRRRVIGALAGLSGSAAVGAGWLARKDDSLTAAERVIELAPASEPTEHGFKPDGTIEYRVLVNEDGTSIDAARITSTEQGLYSHALSRPQSLAASRRGWRFILEGKVEEGSLFCGVDHRYARLRYAMNLFAVRGGPDIARLVSVAVPVTRGLEWPIPGPPGGRHRLEMVLDLRTETTSLWVDGVQRLTGGLGLTDFRYRRGMEFGTVRLGGPRGSAVVWKVRMEIG